MSRLLQVIIALVGLAITGVLGLASERNEALQSRHTLIGLFTQTVSTARSSCDRDLAEMAELTLERLNQLEARPRFMLTEEERLDHASTQIAIERYQDIMAGVKGTIDAGCTENATPAPTQAAPAPEEAAPVDAPDPAILSQAPVTANVEMRRAEQIQLPEAAEIAVTRGRANDIVAADRGDFRTQIALGEYYAVLASYAVGDAVTYDARRGVVADYRRIRAAAERDGIDVQMFQTQTNHFAIVLVPEGLSRDTARRLVSLARTRGWSRDAFVQAARGWTACETPERISPQSACAAPAQ